MGTIVAISVSIWIELSKKEISYTLTYTLYGEEKTLSDTVICEFDGIGFSTKDGFKPRYCVPLSMIHNCDHMALAILWAGKILIDKDILPNNTYRGSEGIDV
ncbi:MAG: hypothetical protein IJD97_01305 [Clostridia bacterium]|nr:hypothetical protein [Clostridia bacterium]